MISNSEVGTFLTCERRHFYAFRKNLAAKRQGKALTRGIVGHEALEAYYGHKKLGMFARQECLGVALEIVDIAIENTPEYTKEFLQLQEVLTKYVDYYWDEPWRILEIEEQHQTPLLDNLDLEYPMRLDLLVEVTDGADKGMIVLVDHKFVYDFFPANAVELNPQAIKYMKTLRDNGIMVNKAMLNQIRYRELKSKDLTKLFRRTPIKSNQLEMDNVLKEHAKVAKKINSLQKLTEEEHLEETTMHLDKNTCSNCSFQPLCKMYLNGKSTQATQDILFIPNSYGYGER